jgi:DNA-directed RNA polymerase specialized sigma24 family protein
MYRFYKASQEGRYPDLADRDALLRLLLQITARRVIDLRRREECPKRGKPPRGVSAPSLAQAGIDENGFCQAMDDALPPDLEATMVSEIEHLLDDLHDDELRAIVLAKIAGATNAEIAAQRSCSQRTVERRLRLIRNKWKHLVGEG